MPVSFSPYLLLRIPAGTPNQYTLNIQEFLNDHHFRSGLLLASPALFSILEKQNFNAAKLSEKEAVAVRKYMNRFCYRPTPFGLFASISLITWSEQTSPIIENPVYQWYCRPDMGFNHALARSNQLRVADSSYEINPSIYRVLNEFRFIRTSLDVTGKHRDYQLQSITYTTIIRDLVTFCETARDKSIIIEKIGLLAGCNLSESTEYANFLIDSHILINTRRMAIAGKDQFQAIAHNLAGSDLNHKMQQINLKLSKLPPVDSEEQTFALLDLKRELSELLPEHDAGNNAQLSVILKRANKGEHISVQNQEYIRDGIDALSLLSGEDELSAMSNFITAYLKHFEGRTMPLLVVLDPEAGIGYQQPLRAQNNPLLETLNIPKKTSGRTYGRWSERHTLLMAVWLKDRSAQPVIRLESADLQRLKGYGKQQQTLGMSVLFRLAGDKVIIENAGGINAPALMGRFTVADKSIKKAAINMAQYLEAKNPDVIFAELLQLTDPHTDNVNTRENVYRYEIPITAVSTLPQEQQLPLSDLYISIVENKVVLFSKKHQKIVVPRLTSAYNHSLNKLPLFRFLADLPYQYGQYNLGLDLRQFFPGQDFYPRVEYNKTILSPATWVISNEQISILQKAAPGDIAEAYKKLSEQLQLPRRFSLAEGDLELVFDTGKSQDIKFFCACIQFKKEVVLKEFFEQKEIRQYNCYLLPEETLSLPRPAAISMPPIKSKRKYLPGSEWLYLKIYTPKIGADRLMLRIRPLIYKRYKEGKITEWFFIRYDDHAPHIRLRLKVVPEAISEILLSFKIKLQDRIHQHLIREYQIDVYSRELERYAFGGIEKTEQFFWASSELVMRFLQQKSKQRTESTYIFALSSTLAMVAEFINDPTEQINFTLESFQQFSNEFSDRPLKIDLNKKYRELTPSITAALTNNPADLLIGFAGAGRNFLQCLKETHIKPAQPESKLGYLRSLIHMHLNRVFADEGRKQEMITYYLIYKYLLSARGRARRSSITS